jgi:hypothetical protein
MDLEIQPAPSPEERAAILSALEQLLADGSEPSAHRSPWRATGIRENAPDESPGRPAEPA